MSLLEERLQEAVTARKAAIGTEEWTRAYAREQVLRKRLEEQAMQESSHIPGTPYRFKHNWVPLAHPKSEAPSHIAKAAGLHMKRQGYNQEQIDHAHSHATFHHSRGASWSRAYGHALSNLDGKPAGDSIRRSLETHEKRYKKASASTGGKWAVWH